MPCGDLVVADVAVVAADALVAARAERLGALAGEDDRRRRRGRRGRASNASLQLEQRLRAEGVAHLGPVDGDLGDPLGGLVPDIAVRTGRAPLGDGSADLVHHRRAYRASRHNPGRAAGPAQWGSCPRLVALSMPGGPRFVDEVRRAWDDGDAVLPVDPRLPVAAQAALVEQMGAAVVIDPQGDRTALGSARPTEHGDAAVIATSGTTGEPKGAVHTIDGLRASARITHAALGATTADHWLAASPLHTSEPSPWWRARSSTASPSRHFPRSTWMPWRQRRGPERRSRRSCPPPSLGPTRRRSARSCSGRLPVGRSAPQRHLVLRDNRDVRGHRLRRLRPSRGRATDRERRSRGPVADPAALLQGRADPKSTDG